MNNDLFIEAYKEARQTTENLLGTTPEDYKILLFVDPELYNSVYLQINYAATPNAVISSNELYVLQQMKEENFIPTGNELLYASRSPRLFMPAPHVQNDIQKEVMKAKLIQAMAGMTLCENTSSRFPDILKDLYRFDTIIYDLFSNNVYEFINERSAPWVWQYFQDFTSTLRLLSLYKLDDFYVPPTSIRSASIFYNYLLEIKQIIKDRAKSLLRAPLFDLVLHGFGDLALNEYLGNMDNDKQELLLPYLKSNLGQPLGEVGKLFIKEQGENIDEMYNNLLKIETDQALVEIWNRGETKEKITETRENLSNRAMVWHRSKDSYWSDLWPMRASKFDKIGNYVGKIQRRGYKFFSELQNDSPLVTSHGRITLKDREVAVLSIQEDTVGQEQLIILRNHLEARKETFTTPLPGLPDIIVFKKYAGMHVASYLGIVDSKGKQTYPKSPYDLPVVVRALQVTSKRNAYLSEEREDDGSVEEVNYDQLEKLTDPQYRAIRYLIRQREVEQ